MLHFISENIGNIIVCVILLVIVGLALRGILVNKKKGKCSCGCCCEGCPSASICHKDR